MSGHMSSSMSSFGRAGDQPQAFETMDQAITDCLDNLTGRTLDPRPSGPPAPLLLMSRGRRSGAVPSPRPSEIATTHGSWAARTLSRDPRIRRW